MMREAERVSNGIHNIGIYKNLMVFIRSRVESIEVESNGTYKKKLSISGT